MEACQTEVFLPNACKPLDWKAAPPAPLAVAALAPRFASQRASALQAKIFDPPKFSEDAARTVGTSVERTNLEPANLALARTFAPADPSPVVDAGELGNETRLNKEAFQFVVDKNLFSIEGQEDFLNKNLAVDFPVPATEVKAAWRMFTEVELDPAKTFRDLNNNGTIEDDERGLRLLERTYHIGYGVVRNQATGTSDLRPFGLVGLHIITKDIPNWFWTTFEHVDNPLANIDSLDRYSPPGQGYPPEVEGTIWRFYRLRGTQVDFVTSVGRPTILGNTQIEGTFQESSSCITCHARASIGRRLDNINAEGGRPLYPPGTHLPPSSEVSRPPTAQAPIHSGRLVSPCSRTCASHGVSCPSHHRSAEQRQGHRGPVGRCRHAFRFIVRRRRHTGIDNSHSSILSGPSGEPSVRILRNVPDAAVRPRPAMKAAADRAAACLVLGELSSGAQAGHAHPG